MGSGPGLSLEYLIFRFSAPLHKCVVFVCHYLSHGVFMYHMLFITKYAYKRHNNLLIGSFSNYN